MSNLLASLVTSASALRSYQSVLQVTQNNVANASTPGWVRQSQQLTALPFDSGKGTTGGVKAGQVQSARNQYSEQAVRRQTDLLGGSNQRVSSLTALESLFDVTGSSGIATGLNNLFKSFSAWGQNATDTVARQGVLNSAADLAQSFRSMAAGLSGAALDTERQIQQTVDQVNELAATLGRYNSKALHGARNDAGLDAGMNATLEELAQYIDFTALKQEDGSVTVLLNSQTALVVGDQQYDIAYRLVTPEEPAPTYAQGRPQAHIFSSGGNDITAATTGGQLGALLDIRNRVLPSYLGDSYQAGDLNVMAKSFADRVNELLTSGYVSEGDPPEAGVPLFSYDTSTDTNTANSLELNPSITPSQLAAISPGPPTVSNGIALALSKLANPDDAADQLEENSYSEYFGNLATRVGQELNNAKADISVYQSMLSQAKELRESMNGVSLDEEATILIQFQRAYEANSRMITILSDLTETAINILR